MSPAVWTVLGGIAVALVSGVVSLAVAALNRRPTQQSTDVATLVAAADEWRELKDDYRTRLEAAEGSITTLTARLDAAAQRERLRDQHVEALERHITDGKPPPPPQRPY